MFKAIASQFLQHLTNQNNWSRKHLMPHAGKIVQFNIALIKIKLVILEDGSLCLASNNSTADSVIHIPPTLALRLAAKDEAAKMLIKIDGDSHLATELGKVMQYMRWDVEEDLSQAIGDIPANKMVSASKNALTLAKKQSINMVEMLAEFWQEEKPILAKKWQVEKFNADVDTIKSDVTRLDKKLKKLQQKLKESQTA